MTMMHAIVSECDTVIVHLSGMECLCCTRKLPEDVKASCGSYGHTSTIHSRGLLVHDHKLG